MVFGSGSQYGSESSPGTPGTSYATSSAASRSITAYRTYVPGGRPLENCIGPRCLSATSFWIRFPSKKWLGHKELSVNKWDCLPSPNPRPFFQVEGDGEKGYFQERLTLGSGGNAWFRTTHLINWGRYPCTKGRQELFMHGYFDWKES